MRSKLHELLQTYRSARASGGDSAMPIAVLIADHLLKLGESDLDERDRSNPACPPVDAARRPEHPMDRIDFE